MVRQAEEEAEKRREELLKQAEAEAKQKIDAATAIAQKAADEEQARKAALQKEIDDAMADGHIDEAEQRAIDAKKAALDEAEKSTQFARQKAAVAAAEAKSVRTKAKQEAEKLKKESEEKAAAMLKQAEDEVKKKVAAATKSANEEVMLPCPLLPYPHLPPRGGRGYQVALNFNPADMYPLCVPRSIPLPHAGPTSLPSARTRCAGGIDCEPFAGSKGFKIRYN